MKKQFLKILILIVGLLPALTQIAAQTAPLKEKINARLIWSN